MKLDALSLTFSELEEEIVKLGEQKFRAKQIYPKLFQGISSFKDWGSKYVRTYGHIVMCRLTGHKMYWQDWAKWKAIEEISEPVRSVASPDSLRRKAFRAGW